MAFAEAAQSTVALASSFLLLAVRKICDCDISVCAETLPSKDRLYASGSGVAKEDDVRTVEPKILYFGTPVALVSSLNEDGSTNLSPISSFWALGWTMTLGLLDDAKVAENLTRHGECVVNLPSPSMWQMVEKLAPLTGKDPVPELKAKQFKTEKDKFAAAGFSRLDSELVRPVRAAECPIQMEARMLAIHEMGGDKLAKLGGGLVAIVEIVRVHVADEFLKDGSNHIDPDKWSPLVYNFRHYYDLSDTELGKTFRA